MCLVHTCELLDKGYFYFSNWKGHVVFIIEMTHLAPVAQTDNLIRFSVMEHFLYETASALKEPLILTGDPSCPENALEGLYLGWQSILPLLFRLISLKSCHRLSISVPFCLCRSKYLKKRYHTGEKKHFNIVIIYLLKNT